MQLDAVQNRVVKSKTLKCSLLKGIKESGKTTTAVYRALYLKNNYCLYDEDKILILAKDSMNRDNIRSMYNKIEDETRADYRTLFTNNVDRVDILTVEDIINRFYFSYTNSCKKWYKIIQEDIEKMAFVEKCTRELRRKYGCIKILNTGYINFLKDEIAWIKACGYKDLKEYQNADRIGRRQPKAEGPNRLLKNSKERKIIFELLQIYNDNLRENDVIDCEDISYIALKMAEKDLKDKYTHIIVDEAQDLSKTIIGFIEALLSNKKYKSLMFIINKSAKVSNKSWFIKGRKLKDLNLGYSIKNYNLSKSYTEIAQGEKTVGNKQYDFMEKFQYLDLKHCQRFDFKRDSSVINEIIMDLEDKEEVLKADELRAVPVYSNIAAGEPIMIDDENEGEFYLPGFWVKGRENYFMLKVKGDSMIGADIFDGDYVIIKKQSLAQNGDIVAVDLEGSATLKRLSLKKGAAVLMPENDKYDPIFIRDRQAVILGIAVGVLKNK